MSSLIDDDDTTKPLLGGSGADSDVRTLMYVMQGLEPRDPMPTHAEPAIERAKKRTKAKVGAVTHKRRKYRFSSVLTWAPALVCDVCVAVLFLLVAHAGTPAFVRLLAKPQVVELVTPPVERAEPITHGNASHARRRVDFPSASARRGDTSGGQGEAEGRIAAHAYPEGSCAQRRSPPIEIGVSERSKRAEHRELPLAGQPSARPPEERRRHGGSKACESTIPREPAWLVIAGFRTTDRTVSPKSLVTASARIVATSTDGRRSRWRSARKTAMSKMIRRPLRCGCAEPALGGRNREERDPRNEQNRQPTEERGGSPQERRNCEANEAAERERAQRVDNGNDGALR